MNYPIDLYWVDIDGRKMQLTKGLKLLHRVNTYHTHPWVFKRPSDSYDKRLFAYASGIVNITFDGETFKAGADSTIHVIISDNDTGFIQLLFIIEKFFNIEKEFY